MVQPLEEAMVKPLKEVMFQPLEKVTVQSLEEIMVYVASGGRQASVSNIWRRLL
jgi:hypothetical protein